jgi:hypothetical protein
LMKAKTPVGESRRGFFNLCARQGTLIWRGMSNIQTSSNVWRAVARSQFSAVYPLLLIV